MLFYNITEAAFRSGLMWVAVLLATMEVVVPSNDNLESSSELGRSKSFGRLGRPSSSIASNNEAPLKAGKSLSREKNLSSYGRGR
jgi:hypothetical protein